MPLLTVLSDNTAFRPHLGAEHGLSILVNTGSSQGPWLWDTGQGRAFQDNAHGLGIDLGLCRGLVFSHGHYDHTGGLGVLWRETGFRGPIYGHSDCVLARYNIRENLPAKPIGMPMPDPTLWRSSFHPVQEDTWLESDLLLVTDIPRLKGNYQSIRNFSLDTEGRTPDLLRDDSALVLLAPSGPMLIAGCCHSGLRNTCLAISERHGISSFQTLTGGLHLGNAPQWALEQTVQTIKEFGFATILPGHCTSAPAIDYLARCLPGKIMPLGSGRQFEV